MLNTEKYIDELIEMGVYSEVDWSKVKVDTPILVRNYGIKWSKRYFAKFVDGKVYAWCGGATSWTADGECDMTSWNYAKLAESEEN